MSKLKLTGQNLDHVFNSKIDSVRTMHLFCYEAKVPNLELKTRNKTLLGYPTLDIVLPKTIWFLRVGV